MSDTHPIQDLLPGYALGILEEQEKSEVRAHLATCASCRAELSSFREVTGTLAASLAPSAPPASLESRIMRAVTSSGRGTVRRLPARRRMPWRTLTGIAATVALVLAAGNFLQYTGVVPPAARGATPRLTTTTLVGIGAASEAYGTIVLDPLDNEGVLAVTGLPRLDARHQYQLWLVRDGERRSAGVFTADAEGYGSMLIAVPTDFRDFRSLGISVEPWGGSPAPTGDRVMAGRL